MKRYLLGRMLAWIVGGLVSLGLAVVAALGILTLAMMTPARHQGLLGAGIGIFTGVVIWPGLLTLCLIFADGFALEGFSRSLLVRSLLWALIPSVFIFTLIKLGINWVGLADAVGGKGPLTIVSLAFFISPSLISAFLGVCLRPPRRGAAS